MPEHVETLAESGENIKSLVNEIVSSGVPLNRIIIGKATFVILIITLTNFEVSYCL